MRPLQILTNKYIADKQALEYKIECEVNAEYPDVDKLDGLFEDLAKLNMKNGYLNKLLIDITNARTNNLPDQPNQ